MLKYFEVESTKIACWVNDRNFGEQEQSLIFIHGSGGDHSLWSLQYAQLHKRCNIAAVDLPGHGRSAGGGERDVEKYCLWMKKILEALRLKKPLLVGHSLGAAIVLKFALFFPQAISGIIVTGGGLKMPVNPSVLELLKTDPQTAVELIGKFSLAKDNRPKYFDPLKKSLAGANIDVLQGDLAACDKFDLTAQISKIALPALVICGVEDKMTPPELSRQIAGGIKGSKLCLIEGAGHMVMMEKAEEFNDALNVFALSVSRVS